jgi:hypothetical protein
LGFEVDFEADFEDEDEDEDEDEGGLALLGSGLSDRIL